MQIIAEKILYEIFIWLAGWLLWFLYFKKSDH